MKSVETTSSLGVVVLGMHRSGTSLTSRLFGTLGCSYGGELMPAKTDNEEGFWEHAEVVRIHDDFLAKSHRSWADPRPLSADDFVSPAADHARAQLEEVFARDFRDKTLWVLKDPRLSRLLPLWDEIWRSAGHRVVFCHTVRNPLAVARSLEKRNGFAQASSLLLWLRHVLEAERFTRGSARSWVAFEDLAQNTNELLQAACRRMGIESAFDFEAAAGATSDAVRPDRIHHVVEDDVLSSWLWIADARRAILALLEAEDESSHATLDRLRREVLEADRQPHYSASVDLMAILHDESLQRALRLAQVNETATGHVGKLEAELVEKEAEIERGRSYKETLEARLAEKQAEIERGQAYKETLEAELDKAAEYRQKLEDDYRKLTSEAEETAAHMQHLERELETKNAYEGDLEGKYSQLLSRLEKAAD